jgi:hypothetical protein
MLWTVHMADMPSFRLARLVLLLGISTEPNSVAAQNQEIARTVRFDASSYTTAGALVGCGFEFSQVLPDDAYERGDPVILRGSISTLYDTGNPLNVVLKVAGQRVDPTKMTTTRFNVHYVYLSADGQSFAGRERAAFRCEDGGFCATYVENAESIIGAIFDNELGLSYNRNEGGLNVSVTFDWTKSIDSGANMQKGLTCYRELFDRFQRQD